MPLFFTYTHVVGVGRVQQTQYCDINFLYLTREYFINFFLKINFQDREPQTGYNQRTCFQCYFGCRARYLVCVFSIRLILF